MKRRLLLFLLAAAALLLLSGCKAEEKFTRNYEIPYVRYLYDRMMTDHAPLRNLTETGAAISWTEEKLLTYIGQTLTPIEDRIPENSAESFGTLILRSPEEVEELLQRPIEEVEEKIRRAEPALSEEEVRNMRSMRLIWPEDQTKQLVFDETFFEESDLLVVDLCCEYALSLPARPEELTVQNGDIRLTVRYGYRSGVTADNYGTLILIPVPKGSVYAEVRYEFVNNWK